MQFIYNPNVWIYIVGALIAILTIVHSIYRPGKLNVMWLLAQIAVTIWCAGFAFQVSTKSFFWAKFWYLVANDFVGVKSATILFIWALELTGRVKTTKDWRLYLLFIPNLVTDLLNIMGSKYIYENMWLITSGKYPSLGFEAGLWYWIITAYGVSLVVASAILLLKAVLHRKLLYRFKGIAIMVSLTALTVFMVYCIITNFALFNYYDMTPVSISLVFLTYSLVFFNKEQETIPVNMQKVIDNLNSGVVIIDNLNRIMDLNDAAENLFDIRIKDVAGKKVKEVFARVPELHNMCLNKDSNYCEFMYGDEYYEAFLSPLSNDKKDMGYTVVIHNITETKAAEAELKQKKQALAVLEERERLSRELHDSLGQILSYANLQLLMIKDKVETGDLTVAGKTIESLISVVREANQEVREFIHEMKSSALFREGFFYALNQFLAHYNNSFDIRVDVENPDMVVDEDINIATSVQLFRIIQEALTNVRKHAKTDYAKITFRKKSKELIVSIEDNGVGFDPDCISLDSFGIDVMNERARHIGASFGIQSSVGKGTVVSISIPVNVAGMEVDNGEKLRVLIADDHVLFMEGLKSLLAEHGYKVVATARDGIDALKKVRLVEPDVVIMDLQMPKCNGLTATKLIKSEKPHVIIVILSMSDDEKNLFNAIKNGASGYLLKSLNPNEFIQELSSIIANGSVLSQETALQVAEELESQFDPVSMLSQRQIAVLTLVAEGKTYKEVASELYVSERTVKYLMAEILKILNLKNKNEAIIYARKCGLA